MTTIRNISTIFICCLIPYLLGAQSDYCSDTLYFCNYGSAIIEGDGELVGPFDLSTTFFEDIPHEFDGENIKIKIEAYFFAYNIDSIRVEDIGTGKVCQIPFVFEHYVREFFKDPEIDCIDYNYEDPTIDYDFTLYIGKKYTVCVGDRVTYELDKLSFNSIPPKPPNDILSDERITQTLGDIEKMDSFSMDVLYTKLGYELMELKTINSSGCPFTLYYPVEVFDTLPPKIILQDGLDVPTRVCQGEPLNLHNQNGNELHWEVSNGLLHTGVDFSLVFDVPGTYQIKASEIENCNCSIPSHFTITVEESIAPNIICTGTLCDGGEVTYYASESCDNYEWSVENGTVVAGGGNDQDFVTILWSDASFGSISLSTPECTVANCPEVTIKDIPIIDAEAPIIGQDSICTGDVTYYSIPNYNGTTFLWEVSEGGYIVDGFNKHEVGVQWEASTERSQAIVSVTYDNCDINCQGYSEKNVIIQPVFGIHLNQNEYCIDGQIVMTNNVGDVVDYTVITPRGDTLLYPDTDTVRIDPDTIGIFGFIANNTNGGICNNIDQTATVVSSYPQPLAELLGPEAVCKEQTVHYEALRSNPNETIIWEVFDGNLTTPLFASTSLELDYQWSSDGPYQIKATVYNSLTRCSSASTTFPIHSDHLITGADSVCLDNSYWYEYNGKPVPSNRWIISPEEAGTILNTNQNGVLIQWQLSGDHTISIDQCDKTTEIRINVSPRLILTHDAPEILCHGDSVLVSFETNILATFDVIRQWSQDTVATEISPSSYLFSDQYSIFARTDIGCQATEYFNIQNINNPTSLIGIDGDIKWCPPGNKRLYARFPSLNQTYQWYRNGAAINGAINQELYTNQFGSYVLKVTNYHGCYSLSDTVELIKCCDNETAPANDNSLDLEETIITCNKRMFAVVPPFLSSNFTWRAKKGDHFYYMGKGLEVTYNFPSAGYYTVYASGDSLCQTVEIPRCGSLIPFEVCEGGSTQVIIPAVANFRYRQNCGSYNIAFSDNSSKLPSSTFTYEWNFGDPDSGNNNFSTQRNPSHSYSQSGNYSVKLTVTDVASGCTTTKNRIIQVRQQPKVSIETNNDFCFDSFLRFYTTVESGSQMSYAWNFGDPDSGSKNTSSQRNTLHEFSHPGTYNVRLRVKDPSNCRDEVNMTVTIVENELSGEVETDKIYPKCPEEEAHLSVPSAPFYRWTNGDSTQSINVLSEGNYRATLSDEYGCKHITDYHFVDNYIFQPVNLFAKVESQNGNVITYQDSLEICYGDPFDIEASYIPDSKYTWTNLDKNERVLSYVDDLSDLAPGRYEFFTQVEEIPRAFKVQSALLNAGYDIGPNGADGTFNVDTEQALVQFQSDNNLPIGSLDDATIAALQITPCKVEAGPFVLVIKALPEAPIVESDRITNCEGELSTMQISNYNPDQTYLWSTGVDGSQIVAYAKGSYQVTTTGSSGCKISSAAIEINDVPDVAAWMTGCREVCLPEEICIDLKPEYTYTLIKNGIENESMVVSSGDLKIDSVGEYQLKATNAAGCTAISDLLVLTKTPDDHDLTGIVYYDENENNVYDAQDVLLEGVSVYLIGPDSLIAETVTDADGYYAFIGFEDYDLQTVIDPSLLDYIIKGATDSTLIYETCIEKRQIDFPLINNCQQVPMGIQEVVCSGKTIIIDGIAYGENDSDTLVYRKAINCDSIVYLDVTAYPIPEIQLSTIATCSGEQSGQLDIHLISGDSLLFTIDEQVQMYGDTSVSGLSYGTHTLYVHTREGCIHPYEFEITEMPIPSLEVETISTCIGRMEGEATLKVTAEDSLYYSLDQGTTFTDAVVFDSLAADQYMLWAIDRLGCIYEAPFEITNYEEPAFKLTYSNACQGEENGSIQINMSNDVATEFRLSSDSIWQQNSVFSNLATGNYTLYGRSEFGCLDSSDFTISTIPEPTIDIVITPECEMLSMGSFAVMSDTLVSFALDGINFGDKSFFDSLEAGIHILYAKDDHMCEYEFGINIPLLPAPDISIITTTTCQDESMGTVEILDASTIPYLYSMDDSLYSSEVVHDQLPAGSYELFVQNEIGCVYTYEFDIAETLPPIVDLSREDSCPLDDTGILFVNTSSSTDMVFLNAEPGSEQREFDNLSPGVYEVWVEDSLGCRTYDEIEIFELPPLVVDVPLLDLDCHNNQVEIRPNIESHQGLVNYHWSDGSTKENFVATQHGQYAVTISDDCEVFTHYWDLMIRHTAEEKHLYAANIFTPNRDGINDCFRIVLDSDLEVISFGFTIFDRWGNRMFSTDNTTDCWDGIYNGEPVELGVYVVISEAVVRECDGLKTIRRVSDITVIR